ncbi:hypothetical protein BLNAU_14029 [Blattamonas nauphoetae]|uniref:Anaphase-promoting complex subunit 4-like WD40 domain-containing protein n=1 Tax=Blattamonas nauphoetae TaxID=2049346 RepID=A0ABQ9XF16_9EUKA|nr:hypothetical protein BLNAU_14029 [Blattamonas nauphoetae]
MSITNPTLFTAQLKCPSVFSCHYSPPDLIVFGGENGFCEVFRLHDSELHQVFSYQAGRSVNSVRFSPSGSLLALGLSGGAVEVIDNTGERKYSRQIHQAREVGKRVSKLEEHCFDVNWIDDTTVLSAGTDEKVFIWKIGTHDTLNGIGGKLDFSMVNSLCVDRLNPDIVVARCSTCIVAFDTSRTINSAGDLIACFGERVPAGAHREDGRNTHFMENGFHIRGGLSSDSKFYLSPSSRNPWNQQSCTLVLDRSLTFVMASILIPRNEDSTVAAFCPVTIPLPPDVESALPGAEDLYLFAIGTQTNLLLYTSIQMAPILAVHTDSPITDLCWICSDEFYTVVATSLEGKVFLLNIPPLFSPGETVVREKNHNFPEDEELHNQE